MFGSLIPTHTILYIYIYICIQSQVLQQSGALRCSVLQGVTRCCSVF